MGALYEFHGWIAVHHHTHDTDPNAQEECWRGVEAYIGQLGQPTVGVHRKNGVDSVWVHGQHNSHAPYVLELFAWVGRHAPGSYGLLYTRGELDDDFVVHRLCRGAVTKHADPFLSPVLPTIEDAYDPSRVD